MAKPPSNDYYARSNVNDPAMLSSRVFIGNLPTNSMESSDLEDMFKSYGKLLGFSLLKGFGFVQFEKESDARKAVQSERGKVYKTYKLDIKMAADGRRGPPPRDRFDEDAPPRERRGPPARDRSPLGDRREFRREPPADAFRRGPPGEYNRFPPSRSDPYRRDPYGDRRDPYDDPYYAPPPPIAPAGPVVPPFDCTIVSMSKAQRGYAEVVERRIKASGLMTDFIILSDEAMLAKAMDDITRQKIPYAVVCSGQNETHRSLTVNILHGTPQEHRNMPLEDAVTLIVRNFEKFKEEMRAKVAPPPRKDLTTDFVAPHPQLSYLMNLMADGRPLTLEELEQIFTYVQTRRNREREARGLPTEKPAPGPVAPVAAPPAQAPTSNQEKVILEQQAQLQAKILSILQGPATGTSNPASIRPYDGQPASNNRQAPSQHQMRPAQQMSASSGGINFDNPSVQRALDNLIQSGPNLLRNIGSSSDQEMGSSDISKQLYGLQQQQQQQHSLGGAYRY